MGTVPMLLKDAQLLMPITSPADSAMVSVTVPYGVHVFEHVLRQAELARMVRPSALRLAARPPRWMLVAGEMVAVAEDEDVPAKRFVTGGRYVNLMDAQAEYDELVLLDKAKKPDLEHECVIQRRAELASEQQIRRARLAAKYSAAHLGTVFCGVLAQCLNTLAEGDGVWAYVYTETVHELKAAATKAGNRALVAALSNGLAHETIF